LGKEILADQPEVSREILNGIREVARQLARYLSRKERVKRQVRRLTIFSRYLPKIARFSAELAGRDKPPNIERLYKRSQVFKDFVTQNDYVDSEIFNSQIYNTIFVHILNKHEENAAAVRVLGLVGSKWQVLIPESVLTSGSELYETLRGSYRAVKIQAKSLKPDRESIIDAYIDGLSQ